ncbi:MAG: putative DNA modification/repair radical SAM protein [Clostridiales bacterium]|jgi:putative DNA modification/repair radical SAM protein|nr:putative DNA modification/repair radical SAM protein [Clostridiales bacterium]
MDLEEKLKILTGAAKYDVACTSSGVSRSGEKGKLGNAAAWGICHSFASDGRCISLLKVLMSNACAYDCSYCVNRRSNDLPRATLSPRELAELTIQFYRRNYIEGLFLSSGVLRNPDYTCEQMIAAIRLLRVDYKFNGYIHAKAIPGTDEKLITELGLLVDRMSVNIELPSSRSLQLLAPNKTKAHILKPMQQIKEGIQENKAALALYKASPKFVPGGQATQLIVGASPETDYSIITLSESLYKRYTLKRVFYSAYIPVQSGRNLPSVDTKPPLLREHRLYQADFLLRFYGFSAKELLSEKTPNFNTAVDPKCNWALNNMDRFPVEVNTAPQEALLRVPGIGVTGAKRIITARKTAKLDFAGLKKLNIVLKRAQYFITCGGKMLEGLKQNPEFILRGLMSEASIRRTYLPDSEQMSIFDEEEYRKCLTGQI